MAGISFLLLEDARHLMTSFLLENLVLENCIDILLLTDRYASFKMLVPNFPVGGACITLDIFKF